MDKDKVIELAKQACHPSGHSEFLEYQVELQRLIQLVRDDYRAELLEGSGEPVACRYKAKDNPYGWAYSDNVVPSVWADIPLLVDSLYTADQLAAEVLRSEKRGAEQERNRLFELSEEPIGFKRNDGSLGNNANVMHVLKAGEECWEGYEFVYSAGQLIAAVLREQKRLTQYFNSISGKSIVIGF
jgi:hypothetical protein